MVEASDRLTRDLDGLGRIIRRLIAEMRVLEHRLELVERKARNEAVRASKAYRVAQEDGAAPYLGLAPGQPVPNFRRPY